MNRTLRLICENIEICNHIILREIFTLHFRSNTQHLVYKNSNLDHYKKKRRNEKDIKIHKMGKQGIFIFIIASFHKNDDNPYENTFF